MNKTIFLMILFLVLISAAASAQILVSTEEKTTCGDGIREGHEMCEPETDQDLCEAAGKILGIVMVCDERDCSCIPKRMDCGNEIQEGAEFCDPGEKEDPEKNDYCPQLGELFNETFTCDPDSCQCVPERYYGVPPPAVCGDGNVTRDEECETDDDCRADEKCVNCTCVIKERNETAIKEIKEELTKKDTKTEEKQEGKKEFNHKDLVGELLPDCLDGFEDERVNVYAELKNGSAQVVGVVTQYGVVQQITDGKIDRATYDFFVEKSKAEEIIASKDRMKALEDAIEAGEVTYKPRGLFARMWYWFVGLFK